MELIAAENILGQDFNKLGIFCLVVGLVFLKKGGGGIFSGRKYIQLLQSIRILKRHGTSYFSVGKEGGHEENKCVRTK